MGMISLPAGCVLYVDAQVIIYTVERHPQFVGICDAVWEQVAAGGVTAITSELSALEVLILPLRNGNATLVERYERFLNQPAMKIAPVSRDILRSAASIRALHARLKTPDAIHLATAPALNCTHLLTNDRQWRGCSSIPTLFLSDLVAKP